MKPKVNSGLQATGRIGSARKHRQNEKRSGRTETQPVLQISRVSIHEQYLVGNGAFGWSHTTPPIFTNQCQHDLGIFWKMYKSEQCSKLGNG
jgi:hypothetical protein